MKTAPIPSSPRPRRFLLLAAALWAATLPTLKALDGVRGESPHRAQGVEEVMGMALLGAFRAVAVDFLMVRAQKEMEEGRFYELLTHYEMVTRLVPRLEAGWLYLAGNLALNIPPEVSLPEARWRYVRKGIELCEKGQERIPDSWRLPSLEAFVILHKCASVPVLRTRIESDRELNPEGLSVEGLALDRGWRGISRENHGARADRIVDLALRRLVARGERSPGEMRSRVEPFLAHLRADGEERSELASFWEAYLEESGR